MLKDQMNVYVYCYLIFYIINVLRSIETRKRAPFGTNLAITRVSSVNIPLKERICTFVGTIPRDDC